MSSTETLSLQKLTELQSDPLAAAQCADEILQSLLSEDEEIRAWACDAMQAIEELPAEPAQKVSSYCMHPVPAVAGWACKLLAKCSPDAQPTQAWITQTLREHPHIAAKQEAAVALNQVIARAPSKTFRLDRDAELALQEAAQSKDARLSRLARQALAPVD